MGSAVLYGDKFYLYSSTYDNSNYGWLADSKSDGGRYVICQDCIKNNGKPPYRVIAFTILPAIKPYQQNFSNITYYSDPYAGRLGTPVKVTDKFFIVDATLVDPRNLGGEAVFNGAKWYTNRWYAIGNWDYQYAFMTMTEKNVYVQHDWKNDNAGEYQNLQADSITGQSLGNFIYGQTQFGLYMPDTGDPKNQCGNSCSGCRKTEFGYAAGQTYSGQGTMTPYQFFGCDTKNPQNILPKLKFVFVPIQPFICSNNSCSPVSLQLYGPSNMGSALYKNNYCDNACTSTTTSCIDTVNCQPGYTCQQGQCKLPPCSRDSDCSTGQYCSNGVCRTGCVNDFNCGINNICSNGTCVSGIGIPGQTYYRCNNGTCTADGGVGDYASLDDCNKACSRYTCLFGSCKSLKDGEHENEAACLTACKQTTYNCTNAKCGLADHGTKGTYTTSTCDNKCVNKYACSNGECKVDSTGTYNSLDDCKAKCNQGSSIWLWIIIALVVIIFLIFLGVLIYFLTKKKPTPPGYTPPPTSENR